MTALHEDAHAFVVWEVFSRQNYVTVKSSIVILLKLIDVLIHVFIPCCYNCTHQMPEHVLQSLVSIGSDHLFLAVIYLSL